MRVLYLDIDTLRPDHLGCYGYHRNTSPNIDRLAAEGVRFDNYYCSDAPCLPSRAACFTGRFGIHSGVVGHGGTAADVRLQGRERNFYDQNDRFNLPTVFREAGLKTVSISPFPERHGAWWFNAGFNETYNTGRTGNESAEEITPVVMDWLERNASDDDWFLHVNYWDPHTPYRAPEEFGNPFENEPIAEWFTDEVLEKHIAKVGPHSASEINMWSDGPDPRFPRHIPKISDRESLKRNIDGYDCGIRYADDQVGKILAALEKAGVLEDTMIIVSADHGENQGELGIYAEHGTADNITCRIPMIVRGPGIKQGHVDIGLHYNLDLAPTLADMFDQKPRKIWDGSSYAASLKDGTETGYDYIVISQCAHVCQRSVRFGDWLYMRTYHDGYHLFDKEMLFNINDDPHEQFNLAAKKPDLCHKGAHLLLEWHDEMMKSMTDGYSVDPLWTVMNEGGPYHTLGVLDKYCERLEKTGRGWAIEELRKRHEND